MKYVIDLGQGFYLVDRKSRLWLFDRTLDINEATVFDTEETAVSCVLKHFGSYPVEFPRFAEVVEKEIKIDAE